ncbi:hypothetical protein [Pantoea anthophila]|uniref:hypothetical protein n=1 Tax=Pantoea anthophila TaxID=470931 RepID=UPI002DBBFF35|nr:hypothetical protein [Pantoea anthophila]MEB6224943.1 hypothetical protein [Pantoea anthophila]
MEISAKAVYRLKNISWFINAGKVSYFNNVKQITAESDFIINVTSVGWENITLEAGNAITGYLAKKQSSKCQHWNRLVREAKAIMHSEIIPTITNPTQFDDDFLINIVKWDLISFLAEDACKELLPNPLFFERLMLIYENGHIPCGCAGQSPSGKLVVY